MQFSLLKSVQPDAASPIHGFNWLVAYSRPVYFCLVALVLLLLDVNAATQTGASRQIAWEWNPFRLDATGDANVIVAVRDAIAVVLLLMPVAFTLGLLPQVSTRRL